jgi:hypothetical protein
MCPAAYSYWCVHHYYYHKSAYYLRMTGREQKSAATVGLFQGRSNLVITDKVLELGPRFAAQTFLQPSAARLSNRHGCCTIEMRLEGIRAAIHFLAHDDE